MLAFHRNCYSFLTNFSDYRIRSHGFVFISAGTAMARISASQLKMSKPTDKQETNMGFGKEHTFQILLIPKLSYPAKLARLSSVFPLKNARRSS